LKHLRVVERAGDKLHVGNSNKDCWIYFWFIRNREDNGTTSPRYWKKINSQPTTLYSVTISFKNEDGTQAHLGKLRLKDFLNTVSFGSVFWGGKSKRNGEQVSKYKILFFPYYFFEKQNKKNLSDSRQPTLYMANVNTFETMQSNLNTQCEKIWLC
jgi:hypothetical protein